ncbi:hypothetical protein TSUD_221980 [Trifolium subterraneum]|uniref:RNA-directed DNA polymerase n=1 Tax=Trifolium subterraneum TaxID=3900 RepID=A0A2Z6NNH1_TRISU|nr:hypothetical protein TSUD_221980 [Trifolium subterraneum]
MPPKKVTIPAFQKMEAKVDALENNIAEVRTTLASVQDTVAGVQDTVRENHANLIALLEKCLGKSLSGDAMMIPVGNKPPRKISEKVMENGASSSASCNETMTEFRHAVKKVELPTFDGEDPAGWISRAEIYFRVQNTTPEIKVKLAQLCMEGSTIHFFNSLIREDEDLSWEKLKETLLRRYGGHGEGDVYEQLTELKQTRIVDEYITEFEYLTAQIPRLPEKQFLGYFMHGLKTGIRGKVRSLSVMGELNRTKLLQVTRAVEREVRGGGPNLYRGSKLGSGSSRPNTYGSGKSGSDWVLVNSGGGAKSSSGSSIGPKTDKSAQVDRKRLGPRDQGFTHFSYQELMERKQKGLCFKCGGAFHPMHQCPDKQLRVLIMEDGDGDVPDTVVLAFQGEVCGVPVLILIDSGATHNFISQKLVKKMGWEVEETPLMNIKLGDGFQSNTKGVCRSLEMKIGDFPLTPTMHLFELGGIDVVLGIEWLKTLGDMIINWRQQTMSFWSNKRWVTLKGIDGDNEHEEEEELTEGQQKELEELLHRYQNVFREPTGLPPRRNKEHIINLVENHSAVNVRPYRYPHHHKNEIERQIQEMLTVGIIRHSTSAFSSPVILVKKKDNSWRMCIDYRALNKVTIPDKFPIPIIEELLDELHGADYYSNKGWDDHMKRLEEVLQLLDKHQLVANQKKCSFGRRTVEYLGHLINKDGVAVDPGKISSVVQWPTPKNVKGVRGFLGLTRYYRKFIKDYGKIAKPLTDLTKKDNFKWGVESQPAFEELKKQLSSAPILSLPNFDKEFVIECDASGVVLAIQHWRSYLLGRKFIVSTDQKSLKQLMQQRIVTAEQQNWAAKLLGYDFEIIYKQGRLNKGVDALSRVHEGVEYGSMTSYVRWSQIEHIKKEVEQDEKLQMIISDILKDPNRRRGYEYKQGVLLFNSRLVVSSTSPLIPTFLKEFHSTPQAGHSEVLSYSTRGLLQPLPIPEQIWEDISMDFITGLPKSKGFEAILVVVDRLSKYSHFVPLKHPYTARSIAEVFCKEVVRLHGVPLSIVSDRDLVFISSFWRELFRMQGTQLKMSTAYHPETDGQTEVVNRCLETYLRCFISDQPKNWVAWIHWAEFWFNANFHSATGKTPFEIVYGRLPPHLTRWVLGETKVEAVQRDLIDRYEALRQLRHQLLRAQEKMKNQADKRRVERIFMVGEWVFVKLRAHRQKSLVTRISAKLSARYYGPYPIIERIGVVAYKLKLPNGSKVHPVFHVSLLKKVVGNYDVDDELPDLDGEESTENFEPEAVLATRTILQQDQDVKQDKVLVEAVDDDRIHNPTNDNIPDDAESLIHNKTKKPKAWLVYSRRGRKGNANLS